MSQDKQEKKQNKSMVPFGIIALIIFANLLEGSASSVFSFIVVLAIFAIPVLLLISFAKKKVKTTSKEHSHDRIDQRQDLKVNPQTGKVTESPLKRANQHSAHEHWKQQLDGLLENGTIDKEEYKALINRRF